MGTQLLENNGETQPEGAHGGKLHGPIHVIEDPHRQALIEFCRLIGPMLGREIETPAGGVESRKYQRSRRRPIGGSQHRSSRCGLWQQGCLGEHRRGAQKRSSKKYASHGISVA
jgi:hypothetical protein